MSNIMTFYSDGGARGNPGPAAYAFVVYLNKKRIYKESNVLGITTNNFAEYSGVINAMKWLCLNIDKFVFEKVIFNLDSELVVRQMTGKYKIKNQTLKNLTIKIKELQRIVNKEIEYKSIRREDNKEADSLVNITLDENS